MALISSAVTAKLISAFVFTYANCWFSHEAAQISRFWQGCGNITKFHISAVKGQINSVNALAIGLPKHTNPTNSTK